MWLMLQQDEPGEYVVASGVQHSVRDLLDAAFARVELDWHEQVRRRPVSPARSRRASRPRRRSSKARRVLGWEPAVSFEELVAMMVDADLERLRSMSAAEAAG